MEVKDQLPRAQPIVIVHGLAMARLAMARATACQARVVLLSAEAAAEYAGVGWWRALMAACGATDHILDCGAAPGRALEALRAGQKRLVLRAPPPIWADLAERTADCGGQLLPAPPPALDLATPGAARHLDALLRPA
jgi:hypothetical protein